jgi:hypothetical protein
MQKYMQTMAQSCSSILEKNEKEKEKMDCSWERVKNKMGIFRMLKQNIKDLVKLKGGNTEN